MVNSLSDPSINIINGTASDISKALFFTSLRVTKTSASLCGASLIHPNYIITSAACMRGGYIKWASIGSKHYAGNDDGEQISLVKVYFHPEYDVAISELARKSSYPPVPISWVDDKYNAPGVIGRVRGLGLIDDAKQSQVVLEAPARIWSEEDCNKKYGKVAKEIFCAGGDGNAPWFGDAGGPFTVDKNGQETLVGIISFSSVDLHANYPAGYTRMSATKNFVEAVLKQPPTEPSDPLRPTHEPPYQWQSYNGV